MQIKRAQPHQGKQQPHYSSMRWRCQLYSTSILEIKHEHTPSDCQEISRSQCRTHVCEAETLSFFQQRSIYNEVTKLSILPARVLPPQYLPSQVALSSWGSALQRTSAIISQAPHNSPQISSFRNKTYRASIQWLTCFTWRCTLASLQRRL